MGYASYDLFDLGEFEQRGSVRTRYGTRPQLLAAIRSAQSAGLQVYADCVLHHKNGGDVAEALTAVPVATNDRNFSIGNVETIQAWTHFTFPGRNGKYSDFQWYGRHFDSVNHTLERPTDTTIYRLKNKRFETGVDPRHSTLPNFRMACDVDVTHPEVINELNHWGSWFWDTTQVNGFRLDAVNHICDRFITQWLAHVCAHAQHPLFVVGEYWSADVEALHRFIQSTGGIVSLFDVPLHYNFHRASRSDGYYDMRRILQGTLVQQQPSMAVTFVENHHSQPLQIFESVVEAWFKPLAYAIILLRQEGYPCIFCADYEGAHYWDRNREVQMSSHRWLLDKFLDARRQYAYGKQYDYFDHFNVVGWTRLGDEQHPKAMAVIMSDGWGGSKWMEVGKPNAAFYDLTEHSQEPVYTNEYGWGEFYCRGGSVSVWVEE
jgi:alpha-amylase